MPGVLDQYASVAHDGVEVFSNTGTVDELRAELRIEPPADSEQHDEPEAVAEQPKATDTAKTTKTDTTERVKGKDAKPRIDTLTFEREEAKRQADAAAKERDEAKAEAARLRDELGRFRTKPDGETERKAEPAKPYDGSDAKDPKPAEADFENFNDYLDARDAWNERRIERKLSAKQHQDSRMASVQARRESFQTRFTEAMASDAALKQLAESTTVEIDADGPMPDVITASPVGIQIWRHFAEHPEEAARIAAIRSPLAKYGEMRALEGEIKASLKARTTTAQTGSVAPVKPGTKAQPPIQPVVSSHVAVKDDGPPGDDASEDEHYAYWNNPKNRARHGLR